MSVAGEFPAPAPVGVEEAPQGHRATRDGPDLSPRTRRWLPLAARGGTERRERTVPEQVRATNTAGVRAYVRRGVIAALLASALGGGAGLFAVGTISSSVDRIVHSLDPLQSDNAAVLQGLSTAEGGISAYEQTGSASFLLAYHDGVAAYQREIGAALDAASGDPQADQAIEMVQEQAVGWIAIAAPLAIGPVDRALAANEVSNLQSAFASFEGASAAAKSEVSSEIIAARAHADSTETVAFIFVSVAALVTLALALIFGFGARRTLVLPLEALVGAISRLRSGDREARVVPDGPAEVQAAGQALNALAERLAGDDQRRGRINALSDLVTRDVREHVDLTALLDEAVASIGVAFGVDRVFVRLAEEGVIGGIAAQWHREGLENVEGDSADRPISLATRLQDFADRPECLVIEDAPNTPGFNEPDATEHFGHLGLVAAVISPIAAAGELIGSLVIVQGTPRHWQDDEVGLIEVASGELGRAVQHSQLFGAQRELVAQLQELDRSKSEFLSTVSHELRTPLTSISGYVEMLEEADAGPINEQQMKMLEIVERNARRLRGLIEDLLTLSRIEVGAFRVNLEPVDVAEVIDSALAVIEPTVRDKGLHLETIFGDDLGLVQADRNQIERALLNLLANAAKFTPEGGTITVSASRAQAELLISVRDTGIGIPPDELEQLSTRFFRASNATERAIPGTGLGLTIVRSVIEHHGGTLEISSELGVGTNFIVRLPADRRSRPRPVAAPGARSRRRG